ncbi:hypothetical protein AWENTII_007981 [Aspergillus wentii]|nr:hypothetical protein MW887_002306 [Aspergillus wentii]
MFYNFAVPRSSRVAKRQKVRQACDFCREHRVRCQATTPCPQCIENRVSCIRPRRSGARPNCQHEALFTREKSDNVEPSSSVRAQSPSGLSAQGEEANTTQSVESDSTPQPSGTDDTEPVTNRMDSMLGFISRINDFCSRMPQLTSVPAHSPAHEQPPAYTCPYPHYVLEVMGAAECSLSNAQIERLLRIFWTRLRLQVPIVQRRDLDLPAAQRGQGSPASPLRDAITAYSMQSAFYLGLNTRLLGLQWDEFMRGSQSTMVGMSYFRRCLAATTQYTTFSGPSILALQCYCFMTLYLLDAGQHQAAYNMVGLAVRIAQSLNLHQDPTASTPRDDAEIFRRIWWTLVHLDFRCSRHLGKPISVQLRDSTCVPPHVQVLEPEYTSYHAQSMRLTAAALSVIDSIVCYPAPETTDCMAHVEARAKILSGELGLLCKWREEVLQDKSFRSLQLDIENMSVDADDEFLNQPPPQILLATLLELQHHDIIITLHRVFIQFPTHTTVPKNTPRADVHAATALKHAMATINVVHCRMTHHDALYGSCELYQYQWNAVLTLIGFMLAYPFCHRFQKARKHTDMALEIFESAGSQNIAAARAACLTRHLCSKVDTLVRILNITERPDPADLSKQDLNTMPGNNANTANQTPDISNNPAVQPTGIEEHTPISQQLQDANEDVLWPRVDLLGPESWAAYCNEVNEAFTGLPDINMFHDSLFFNN